jgi:hypothetical protein
MDAGIVNGRNDLVVVTTQHHFSFASMQTGNVTSGNTRHMFRKNGSRGNNARRNNDI